MLIGKEFGLLLPRVLHISKSTLTSRSRSAIFWVFINARQQQKLSKVSVVNAFPMVSSSRWLGMFCLAPCLHRTRFPSNDLYFLHRLFHNSTHYVISEKPRLPVRMMRRVKVAALPGTSNSDENSRATTPNNYDFLNENYTKNEIEDYRQLFCMFDTDGSGAIGNSELKEAILSIGLQASDQDIDALIREVDEDGNGEIDFAEFCHCMKKSQSLVKSTNEELIKQCFNVFDQDGNGVITANEFMVRV